MMKRHSQWPSGHEKTIAVLQLDPEQLSRRFGLEFVEQQDELGSFDECPLRLPSGKHTLLLRYRDNPSQGTEIIVDSQDDLNARIGEIFVQFGLTRSDLVWIATP